ncbi:hypothetical protein GINT2_001143 [Glugoides intestinalis]
MYDNIEEKTYAEFYKKAKVRKNSMQCNSQKQNVEERVGSGLMCKINKDLLDYLSYIIYKNESADLRELGKAYRKETKELTGGSDTLFSFTEYSLCCYKSADSGEYVDESSYTYPFPMLFKKPYANTCSLTESYLALASVFKVSPLPLKTDSLEALLELEFGSTLEEEPASLDYIDVKDVVKSKGNAINGPRREDVGTFNRKLFDSYSKQVEQSKNSRLLVNINFFSSYKAIFNFDRIITADFVCFHKFNYQSKQTYPDCLFVIHERSSTRLCTVIYKNTLIIDKIDANLFMHSLSKCKRKIHILHKEHFFLFSMEFLCESAALFASSSLSSSTVL